MEKMEKIKRIQGGFVAQGIAGDKRIRPAPASIG
jgi:hypothetical protein